MKSIKIAVLSFLAFATLGCGSKDMASTSSDPDTLSSLNVSLTSLQKSTKYAASVEDIKIALIQISELKKQYEEDKVRLSLEDQKKFEKEFNEIVKNVKSRANM